MAFEMGYAAGSYAYSDAAPFNCADGEIYTAMHEDQRNSNGIPPHMGRDAEIQKFLFPKKCRTGRKIKFRNGQVFAKSNSVDTISPEELIHSVI